MQSQTDWTRVATMTQEEIEALDTSDEGLDEKWWEHAVIVYPLEPRSIEERPSPP